MRALQTLLIAIGMGSVAAAAAEAADHDTGSGVSVLEPWPDFTAPARPPAFGAGACPLVEEPDVTPPVFFDETSDLAPGAGDDELFDKGTWALQLTGSYYTTVAGNEVTLAYGTVNLGYYYADTWAIDLHVSGYALAEDGEAEGVAASLGLNLRKHFWIRDPWSIYIDGGTGMFRADGKFPEGGTHTNFTLQAGLGATYRLNETLHLVGGARWFHISNARRHGEDENESTDGVAVYGGLMWTW